MKHTTPNAFLSRRFLCYIRDHQPTVEEFVAWADDPSGQALHVLRKSGVVVVENDRMRLNRRHLSPDGQRFVWQSRVFLLDRDEVQGVRWGPGGPPVYCAEP